MAFFETVKKVVKGVYIIVVSFFEAITVSFYQNIKRRYAEPSNEYVEVKVPRGYKDTKASETDYKDLSSNGEFADYTGLK